jgi:hypothetical protein
MIPPAAATQTKRAAPAQNRVMPMLSEFAETDAAEAGPTGSANATWQTDTTLVTNPIANQVFARFTHGKLWEEQHIKSELYER